MMKAMLAATVSGRLPPPLQWPGVKSRIQGADAKGAALNNALPRRAEGASLVLAAVVAVALMVMSGLVSSAMAQESDVDDPAQAAPPSFHPRDGVTTEAFIDTLEARGLPRSWASEALSGAHFRQSVLDAMDGAVERRLEWHEYREIFMDQARLKQGAAFMQTHQAALERAEQVFGVPPEVVAAIIGIETRYGRVKGNHPVLESLATLGFFHPTRREFFKRELMAFLEIAHQQGQDPNALEGSYAGAMGYPQFIPSSYQAYAIDFDDDGLRDLWDNPVDAIGSVANYLAEHGWQKNLPLLLAKARIADDAEQRITFNATGSPDQGVGELMASGLSLDPRASLPAMVTDSTEVVPLRLVMASEDANYWLGSFNFYVIMRYNHSHLYAMAVSTLAEALAKEGALPGSLEVAP